MIEPAVTVSPANTLTPSRWACESRPFFEEPRPFLCAIAGVLLGLRGARLSRRLWLVGGCGRRGLAGRRLLVRRLLRRRTLGLRRADRVDLDAAQLRAVPARLLEAALGLEGEDLDLL